jgi:hypothetical protein
MRTTIHLPDDLLKRAKQKAAADGRTLTSLIEEGLRTVLAAKPAALLGTIRLPRVSHARGGLVPGLDPLKLSAEAQQRDDIEAMRRVASQRSGER